jgi:putative ATP-binding cassette transporter
MGLWPFAQGIIRVPAHDSMMSIPQKPYFPLGALRSCLTYPHSFTDWTDEAFKDGLRAVGLSSLENHLDEAPPQHAWSLSLSGGEQQRLAFARALLQKPAWIFLDESTSAMDEAMELDLYTLLQTRLPEATLISISHRSSLKTLHKRVLNVTSSSDKDLSWIMETDLPKPDMKVCLQHII